MVEGLRSPYVVDVFTQTQGLYPRSKIFPDSDSLRGDRGSRKDHECLPGLILTWVDLVPDIPETGSPASQGPSTS